MIDNLAAYNGLDLLFQEVLATLELLVLLGEEEAGKLSDVALDFVGRSRPLEQQPVQQRHFRVFHILSVADLAN